MKSYIFLQALLIGLIIPDFSFSAARGKTTQPFARIVLSFRTFCDDIRGQMAPSMPSNSHPPSGGDEEWPDLEDVLASSSAETPRDEDLEGGVISQSSGVDLTDRGDLESPPPPPPRATLSELMETPLEGLWARVPWRGCPATLEEVELSIRIMEVISRDSKKMPGQADFEAALKYLPLLRRLREAALRPPAEPAAGLSRTESTEALFEEPEV